MDNRIYLLPELGRFYKANLHSHTTLSDGKLTPEENKNAYKKEGYSVVAYTDHRKYYYHRELNDDSFLALAAYEVDISECRTDKNYPREKLYHINLYDTNPEINSKEKELSIGPENKYFDVKYINTYVKKMTDLGFLACYNHPYWSLQNYSDYKDLEGFFAMEIYNYGCEIDGLYGYNPQAYDEILRTGKRWFCMATDDNHNRHPFYTALCDSFGGFTMIKAQEFTYQSIIKALMNGDFYSSMGPQFKELYIQNGILVIKTEPVEKIYVMTEGRDCYIKVAESGETITEARFALSGREGYIRVQCRGKSGLMANSNAYFLDKLEL